VKHRPKKLLEHGKIGEVSVLLFSFDFSCVILEKDKFFLEIFKEIREKSKKE